MLCPISALNPCGGPERLIDVKDLEPVSREMASEIISYGHVSLSHDELTTIVSSALRLTLPPAHEPMVYDLAPKLPDGISDWVHFYAIGIGHFHDIIGGCNPNAHGKYPSGQNVETRHLDAYNGYGRFYVVIEEGQEVDTWTSLADCNIFVLKGPLEYLRAWLDPALPPRVAFKDSVPTMSLEGELFEILNTRNQGRGPDALLRELEYDDIAKTLEEDQWRFLNARKGSRHVSQAIVSGLRGSDLLPALFSDFQCWQSMRPDVWPVPNNNESSTLPVFTAYESDQCAAGNPFKTLPTELLLEILRKLPIISVLTLSSASKALRATITHPAFINQVIKSALLSGSEHWVLPVNNLPGEVERSWTVAYQWLRDESACSTESSPFLLPSFPHLEFLKACYASDSMRNRQRLWRMVKQFDDIWRDYRLHGWQTETLFFDSDP